VICFIIEFKSTIYDEMTKPKLVWCLTSVFGMLTIIESRVTRRHEVAGKCVSESYYRKTGE